MGFTLLNMIRSRCKAGQLKMIETSFEKGSYSAHIMEEDIRAVIGDNVEMRVEEWTPLYLDYRYSFSGQNCPSFVEVSIFLDDDAIDFSQTRISSTWGTRHC